MQLDKLVDNFADSVAQQQLSRDAKTSNKHTAAYVAAFEALRAHGNPGRDALARLLEDKRAEVRVTAAAFLLRYCEDRARAVLEAEAQGGGILAFEAEQALDRWKEGTWELDPP
jgi:hypothetical protein